MSDDTKKPESGPPSSGAPNPRKRRRRRGGRKRSGGGGGGGEGQKKDGQSGGGGQPGSEGGAPKSGERKRRRRRGRRRGGRGRPAEGGAPKSGEGAQGQRRQEQPRRDGAGGEGRRDGGRSRRRSGRSRGRDRDRDGNRERERRPERRRSPEFQESRPEAIPEAADQTASASGPAPEMTEEGLAHWQPPLLEADPDREDVLPALAAEDEIPDEPPPPRGEVFNLAHVRVQTSTRLQDFDAGEMTLERGDTVVVQGDRGQAIGKVVAPSARVLVTDKSSRRVLRRATEHDLIQRERNDDKGGEAMPYARERIVARKLPMKLTQVEYLHGGSKAVFYFSAEGRVDFRELVKDLAQRMRTRIEMRQIGVRDEAKMVGGIGVCGLRLCCHRYLTKFEPVSIRMAKDQNLVLNPQKVSGQCGRLKCCLAYEQEIYREQRKGMPKLGKFVETPDGVGKVVELDILGRRVRVALGMGKSETFSAEEVEPAPPPQRR